jgi:hypothetical protein
MVILKHIKGPDLLELEAMLTKVQKSIVIQGAPHLEGSTWYIHFLVQDPDGLESELKLKSGNTINNTKTSKMSLQKEK